MNSFVKKSEATLKNGKVKKGYTEIKMVTKTGKEMIRYKKDKVAQSKKKVAKKPKGKVVQVKKCTKVTRQLNGKLHTTKECDIVV